MTKILQVSIKLTICNKSFCCLVVLLFCWLPILTTKQQDNYTIRFVWKTIPSAARVTRDEVSGCMKQRGTTVWKTVPKHTKTSKWLSALSIRYCLPDSSFLLVLNPETSSRVTLATLGIGFQPNLHTTPDNQTTKQQTNKPTRQPDNNIFFIFPTKVGTEGLFQLAKVE